MSPIRTSSFLVLKQDVKGKNGLRLYNLSSAWHGFACASQYSCLSFSSPSSKLFTRPFCMWLHSSMFSFMI